MEQWIYSPLLITFAKVVGKRQIIQGKSSIDELLSGDQLVLIAEKENKSNLNSLCDLLFGVVDVLSLMLIFLPLYPKSVDGYIYSVNLIEYVDYV